MRCTYLNSILELPGCPFAISVISLNVYCTKRKKNGPTSWLLSHTKGPCFNPWKCSKPEQTQSKEHFDPHRSLPILPPSMIFCASTSLKIESCSSERNTSTARTSHRRLCCVQKSRIRAQKILVRDLQNTSFRKQQATRTWNL